MLPCAKWTALYIYVTVSVCYESDLQVLKY